MKKFFEFIKLREHEGKTHSGTISELMEFMKSLPQDANATLTVDMPEADNDKDEDPLAGKTDPNGKFRRPLDNA